MSRVGKLPIPFSDLVDVDIREDILKVVGPKGALERAIHKDVQLKIENRQIHVSAISKTAFALSMWGTIRSIVNNMVVGVSSGFVTELEVIGVGYRVAVKGDFLHLALGKSHSIKILIPAGITVLVPKPNNMVISGIDKEKLGQFVATVIKQRPTEPFKGKGIKFKNQVIKKKEGKKN